MKKYLLATFLILLFIGCTQDPILGQWERYGDEAAGSVVLVQPAGDKFDGRLIWVDGILKDLGFYENDIKWRDILAVGPNRWRGKDLIKIVDANGIIKEVEYKDVYFTLMGDGTLEIRKFAREEEIVGTEQKWRKIQ
ncbi:hypothetical protein A2Y85_04935 [candidate division WOR-3 bacterium RBG_13_43_14]|uniref:Lipoprotein n=1 Tax=candidate division WOR-3 bacterium RBG_13_43_14 TaxID=1802590 RepID=A0A1F4UG54_UNCW3|nr:MAG: hypothetical protein A2Y85_04935 [candidate division WOR-3 bacterium RBG_13_43_14]